MSSLSPKIRFRHVLWGIFTAVSLLLLAGSVFLLFKAQNEQKAVEAHAPIITNAKANAEALKVSSVQIPGDIEDVLQAGNLAIVLPQSMESMTAAQEQVEESISHGKSIAALCDGEINSAIAKYEEAKRIAAEKQRIANVQSEIASRPGMIGRFYVPSVGIDVALFAVNGLPAAQYVVDAADSCAYMTESVPGAVVLADHSNQDFGALRSVTTGMKAQIVTANGTINLVASSVTNGHNYTYLTDGNGTPLQPFAPYFAYTCLDNWQNIRIVGWSLC